MRPWAEQLQTENERLVEELAQLRDRAILAEEEKTHRDREAQQLTGRNAEVGIRSGVFPRPVDEVSTTIRRGGFVNRSKET